MLGLGYLDSRSFTDYRQNCVRELEVQNRVNSQLGLKTSNNLVNSIKSKDFLQKYSSVIRDTDRNMVFNKHATKN